jgi:hypothetical protein
MEFRRSLYVEAMINTYIEVMSIIKDKNDFGQEC